MSGQPSEPRNLGLRSQTYRSNSFAVKLLRSQLICEKCACYIFRASTLCPYLLNRGFKAQIVRVPNQAPARARLFLSVIPSDAFDGRAIRDSLQKCHDPRRHSPRFESQWYHIFAAILPTLVDKSQVLSTTPACSASALSIPRNHSKWTTYCA